jgi:hypothetical protein
MRTEVSSAPVGLRVQRHFDGNRFAGDCQARAYEQILPVAGPSETTQRASSPGSLAEVKQPLAEQGVAA